MLVTFPRPHPGASTCPSTPKVLQVKECASTLCSFVIFTFGLVVESIKELGGVSRSVSQVVIISLFSFSNLHLSLSRSGGALVVLSKSI